MRKRKFVRQMPDDANLLELLCRLERALAGTPVRVSVWRGLADISMRLGADAKEADARERRCRALRHRRLPATESLSRY